MKIGIRKLYYAVGGGCEYQERVENWHCYYSGKHGRYKKDKNLSRKVRHFIKNSTIDDDISNIDVEDKTNETQV